MTDEQREPEFPPIPEPPAAPPIPSVLREPPARIAPQRRSSDAGMWGMAKAWGVALDFIFTIVAGGGLGWAFDYWKQTAPKGVMIGLAAGFVVAFIRIVRATVRAEREETRRKNAGRS